jgi:serine/threonine protein kinase
MAMMFGRFEILSEISRSEASVVFKATDTESNQTVALKTLHLETLGERASDFVDALIAEGESTRDLASQNIAVLYGAGEIEDQFCAAMEYVQGNSVATMLTRKEGFSIWDLLDITRQVCAGLEHAASLKVAHQSLEPAKVMVQWDGLVKILGYGISSMSLVGAETGAGLGKLLPYCSPEQVRGEPIDLRSNLFTWGAILYEMMSDRKAFDAEDPVALVNQISNEMPPSPVSLNPKVHAGVSALIMKSLAKNPEERYQTTQELVADLEKCKEGGAKQAAGKKPATATKAVISDADRAAAASRFVSPAKATHPEPPTPPVRPVPPAPRRAAPPAPVSESVPQVAVPQFKVSAAAAGAGAGSASGSSGIESYGQFVDERVEAPVRSSIESRIESRKSPVQSAAVAEPETELQSMSAPVDPMVSASAPAASSGRSFSDMDELPPMKEAVYVPPPPPPSFEAPEPSPLAHLRKKEEKPGIQAREVAEKAIKEIKTVPPKLMIYSIMGAVGLILIVSIALYFHVRSEDDDSTAAPRPTAASKAQSADPAPMPPAVPQAVPTTDPAQDTQPEVTVRQIDKRGNSGNAGKRKAPAAVMAAIPGQVQIDSTPQGAQIQIDGRTDPSWLTPFNLTGLSPGQHTISVSKSGYSPEARAVDVTSASKSFVALHLSPVNALLVLNSTPTGANVVLDGRDTGKTTPAQFAVEKGSHTVVLRKQGFLDESASADLTAGQNFQFAPALRALGNADEIKSVGKLKKFFGGNSADAGAGMGTVSIRTQPKGAQIAINRRLLDKQSPAEFMVGPGHYEVDVTLTGFKPIHKVISVEKGGKVAVDEILERE